MCTQGCLATVLLPRAFARWSFSSLCRQTPTPPPGRRHTPRTCCTCHSHSPQFVTTQDTSEVNRTENLPFPTFTSPKQIAFPECATISFVPRQVPQTWTRNLDVKSSFETMAGQPKRSCTWSPPSKMPGRGPHSPQSSQNRNPHRSRSKCAQGHSCSFQSFRWSSSRCSLLLQNRDDPSPVNYSLSQKVVDLIQSIYGRKYLMHTGNCIIPAYTIIIICN